MLINKIKDAVCVFVILSLFIFSAKNTLADDCGTYQSGPTECVSTCKWESSTGYCKNNLLTICQPGTMPCGAWTPPDKTFGCWTWGTIQESLDCSSYTTEYSCINAWRDITQDYRACAIIGGGGETEDCSWYCVAHSSESETCAQDACYPACSGATPLCCRPISCSSGGGTTPSCIIGVTPSAISIATGSTAVLSANVLPSNGTVSSVNFSSSSTSRATVSPASDTVSPYATTVTAGSTSGAATITASVIMSGVSRCTATATIIVLSNPWWQVKDSDVVTNGNLNSSVPTALYFSIVGSGGYPGLPVYGGTTNLTSTNVSAIKWLANSAVSTTRAFNSSYFENAIPSDATINQISATSEPISYFASGGTAYNGYYYYEYDAGTSGIDFSITAAASSSIGGRKVVLLVKGASVNLATPINLTKGKGMFLVVTTGNINVASTIGGGATPNLEGIYVADGTINTGAASTKLYVRGTMVGYGGIVLQRDLGSSNSTTPAEYFEYAPDQELLFPGDISYVVTRWQEVAP